jgi:hypothetical protein
MPAVSEKQKRLMDAAAHNKSFAKKAGVPQNVAKEFSESSKGMKFRSGGATKQGINLPKTNHGKSALFKEGGQTMATMKNVKPTAMGKVKTAAPSRDGVATKGKTKGTQIKMAGASMGMKKGGATKKMAYGGKAC